MRYFKLAGFDGPTPKDYPLAVGTIVRVPRINRVPRSAVFNLEAKAWVFPQWDEVSDPSVTVGAE